MSADLVIENLRGAFVGPVSLSVTGGSCAAITGPSGVGKTLLLRMIADLDPNDGEVRLGALRRAAVSAPEWRRRVTYVAAEARWWQPSGGAHFRDPSCAPVRTAACALGLERHHFDRPVATLSTGERQRLALLRAVARKPEVLLLDEPTSGLDPGSVERVERLVAAQCAEGLAIVLVTHDAAQARRLGRRHYRMDAGKLVPA